MDDKKEYQNKELPKYIKDTKKRKDLKKTLLDELETNGISNIFYKDLIDDYMDIWDIKNELIHNIKVQGVSIYYQNGPNQWGYKKNKSVSELNRANSQMLKILYNIGIKPVLDKVADDFEL